MVTSKLKPSKLSTQTIDQSDIATVPRAPSRPLLPHWQPLPNRPLANTPELPPTVPHAPRLNLRDSLNRPMDETFLFVHHSRDGLRLSVQISSQTVARLLIVVAGALAAAALIQVALAR